MSEVDAVMKLLEQIESSLILTDNDKQLLADNPTLLHELYADLAKAILMHHIDAVVYSIVEKAKSGDVPSARFVADFVQPLTVKQDSNENVDEPAWSTLAVALRDALGLESSPVEFVEQLLQRLNTRSNLRLLRRLFAI